MICSLCSQEYDNPLHTITCLVRFKDKVYELFGFHPDTNTDFVYNEILRLREIARGSKT